MHVANLLRIQPRIALRTGLIAAAALWIVAAPVPAADSQVKGGNAATIKITQDPPPVQIEAQANAAAAAKDANNAKDATDGKDSKDVEGKRGKRSHGFITFDNDQEFETFNDVKKTAPWFIGIMFLFVGTLFLTPIILLIGIVWYKLRKARMQNEALLKLAERGVIPPAQAIDAVSSGVMPGAPGSGSALGAGSPEAAAAGISTASAYENAVQTRRRAVWSDLRKGVLLSAVGLSIVVYSAAASGNPNWLGLALLFVGIGYLALWWLEDRQLAQRAARDLPNQKG
ncbi:MAG: hypothetical protein ABI537_01585 [Casimicrobiaceae bacterium]